MLLTCWSVKGGSGTTVVAAALALLLARTHPAGALLVDLAGDAATVLGVPEPDGPGITGWLTATDPDSSALARLEADCGKHLRIIGPGQTPPSFGSAPARGDLLCAALQADARPVVADCGVLRADDSGGVLASARHALAAGASHSLLVTRPCFVAIRRALAAPIRPSGVVLVDEVGRALRRADIEDVLGVPVRAVVDVDAAVARAVDAGLLTTRVPRGLERALRAAA
jgi:hypothetical protein